MFEKKMNMSKPIDYDLKSYKDEPLIGNKYH